MTSNIGVKKIQDFGSGVGFGTTATGIGNYRFKSSDQK